MIQIIGVDHVRASHDGKLGFLQDVAQLGVARVDEFHGFELGFVAYSVNRRQRSSALGLGSPGTEIIGIASSHGIVVKDVRRTDLGSAPASSNSSAIDDADSHCSWRNSLMKRTALCSGVSCSRRLMGSTSRPSWSRRASRISSAVSQTISAMRFVFNRLLKHSKDFYVEYFSGRGTYMLHELQRRVSSNYRRRR